METQTKDLRIQIDRDVITTSFKCLTGRQILELAGKVPYEQYQLYIKLKGNKVEKVQFDQTVCFDEPGIEKFTTQKRTHTDGGGPKYKIQIDRDHFDAPEKCMTGQAILQLAGKIPHTEYQLYIRVKGNKVNKVGNDETVCLDDPGIERFNTQKLKHQDGETKPRRDFDLLETDKDYLDASALRWDAINDNGMQILIIRDVQLPAHYNIDKADIAIRMDTGYPRQQLDMAYFCPPLSRGDGKPINALTPIVIEGRGYQQWSRHRTPDNPWVEDVDCLATHLGFVEQWLLDEFKKTPHAESI